MIIKVICNNKNCNYCEKFNMSLESPNSMDRKLIAMRWTIIGDDYYCPDCSSTL